jgi:ribosomal protein L11
MILKELGIQKGAKTKEEVVGNMTMEQAKNVVKAKDATIYGKTLADKVKQVLGTCNSMNITFEGMPAKEAIAKINSGEIKV